MIINYLNSYDRSFKKIGKPVKEKAIYAINALLRFLETRQKPKGLGLKKVYKGYWEIRLDIKNRIIFQAHGETINIIFVGDHNAIKAFLRNI